MAQYGQGEPLGASYRLVELLGTGAAGEVWRVEHTATGDQLAAKLLRPEHAADPEIVERFVRERSVLLALQHPSIVRVRDLVVEGDRLAIVMDLVTGGSARDLLAARGTLPAVDALTITAETLDALAAAHERQVTHRDVKPDNVLLSSGVVAADAAVAAHATALPAGSVRVSDFGIASVVADRERKTTGLLGTPQYMAPETISHGRSGPAADVYGAGVMLYELLGGRTPFAGPGTDFAVAYRHVTSTPPRLDVPDTLWRALEALLAKDPSARPSAAEAATTLRRLAKSLADLPALDRRSDPETFDEVARPATMIRGGAQDSTPRSTPVPEDDSPAPEIGAAGSETVIRPMSRRPLPADPAPEPEPTGRFRRPDWLTNRALGFGALGVVLVAALVVGGIVWLPGALAKRPSSEPTSAQAATAYQQDRQLPTGLATTRKATVDASTGAVELSVTYSAQSAPLRGPFLEVVPGVRKKSACPVVAWDGESVTAKRNQPSLTGVDTSCAWSLGGVEIPAGGQTTVRATVRLDALGSGGLQTWLDEVGTATTDAVTDQSVTGTAYPVQRLQGIDVKTPDRTVSQTTLPITLVPVWPNGADELDPLYRSPSTGSPSQMLVDIAGGESGVRFSDGCSGALAVSSDGLVVTALSVAPNCTVRAKVGAFSDLESQPFGITTRD